MSISDSNRQQLAASFLTGGEAYDRYRPGFPAEAADAAVDGREGAVVLDVGAGTGKFTELLASRAAQVIAVDPSEDMLAQLRRKLPTVAARVGPAEDLPVEDAAVDAVTVAQAFHWFDRDRAAAEFARVLRPGGLLTLLWNVPDPDSSWDRACYRIAHHVASPRDDARPDAFRRRRCPGSMRFRASRSGGWKTSLALITLPAGRRCPAYEPPARKNARGGSPRWSACSIATPRRLTATCSR